jgi:anthranilate phosphoribosyltransferase
VTPAGVERREIDAADAGLARAPTASLAGGTPQDNAAIIEAILRGEPGARRDVVLLNAGAAFLAAGRAESIEEGVALAGLTIDSGMATVMLERLREERRSAEAGEGAAQGAPA